jgi:hypothetical protein
MSDVTLATRYAAENYPIALKNLAKRYQRNDDGEAIHYSELGFGDISDQQAKSALRFFANIGLIENTKRANYIPPESVVTWQRKMGDRAKEAKSEVHQSLRDYEVFSETEFVLEEGEEELDQLAEQVGGMVGIDEDELSDMEKTIEVFSELGFVNISDDDEVSLPDSSGEGILDSEELDDESPNDSEESNDGEGDNIGIQNSDQSTPEVNAPEASAQSPPSKNLSADLEITIDATEMDIEDLQKKLEIIDETIGYDGK